MTSLTAENLCVTLGGKAVLQDVSMRFMPGQVTAVVGPNGAGKSTLLTCLAGLRQPDTGAVRMGDQDIAALSPRARARRVGFLPQIPEVAWALDVRTLVGLGRIPHTGARGLTEQDHHAVSAALAATATEDLAHRSVTTLSGGERARVLLARAMAGDPQWLLADEPLAGLDPGHQLDTAALMRRTVRGATRGIVVTLHDLHIALRLADRVIVIANGRLLADDTPQGALTPEVLAAAYGIRAHVGQGIDGPVIEIMGRDA